MARQLLYYGLDRNYSHEEYEDSPYIGRGLINYPDYLRLQQSLNKDKIKYDSASLVEENNKLKNKLIEILKQKFEGKYIKSINGESYHKVITITSMLSMSAGMSYYCFNMISDKITLIDGKHYNFDPNFNQSYKKIEELESDFIEISKEEFCCALKRVIFQLCKIQASI